jgi:multidrug efflux system membrane fusion protein
MLFEIDSRTYRAELDRAEAALSLAMARFNLAEATQKRTAALFAKKAASQEEIDRADAQRVEAEASIRLAKSVVQIARLNLDYTQVRAPFAGQIGRRLVDPGNLVTADQTILGVLVNGEPMHVYFDVDERTLLRLRKQGGAKGKTAPVFIALAGETGYLHRGTVDFQDNRVNPDTGTIVQRALVPNKEKLLTPGMFARVRLAIGEPYAALLVNSQLVLTEDGERFVLVVNDKNVIEKRKVILGQENEGLRAIKAGLKPEDRVVCERTDGLRPGMAVRPRLVQMPSPPPEPAPDGVRSSAPAGACYSARTGLRGQPGAGMVVEAAYPGASAQVVSETVRAPIEQQVSGLEKLRFMRSRCTDDGRYGLALYFERGGDPNMTQVLVQNRVSLALPVLPAAVQNTGINVLKGSSGALLMINLLAPDGKYDQVYLSNYANIHLKDELSRLAGVGAVSLVGQSDVSLRIGLDPDKLAARGLNAGEVAQIIEKQKAARDLDTEKLGDLVLKAEPIVRLKDVARVEFGAARRQSEALLDGKPVVTLVIQPLGDADSGQLSAVVRVRLKELRARLPQGLDLDATFDFTANRQFPDRPTTPEYLLIDVSIPVDSPERVSEALKLCGTMVREVPGVQHILVLSENPFDCFGSGPCILALLTGAEQRKSGRQEVLRSIRSRLGELKEISVRVRDLSGASRFPRCGYPVDLALRGPDAGRVRQWAKKLAERLGQDQKLTDVWANRDSAPRLHQVVEIDRDAATSRGISLEDISQTLKLQTGLSLDNAFTRFGRSWRVDLQYEASAGALAEDIRRLKIRNGRGEMIPLGAFATVRETSGPRTLDFLDSQPMVAITANLAAGTFDEPVRKLCQSVADEVHKDLGLSAEYRLTWLRDVAATK